MDWISTKEKLPRRDTEVIASLIESGFVDRGKRKTKALFLDKDEYHGVRWLTLDQEKEYSLEDVTHWMPMPKYRGKK